MNIFVFLFRTKDNSKTYNVSICAIFKDEAYYLKEWIEFHRIIGIDHFYMYNNNSEDDFLIVLQHYIDLGIVTLIDWPKKHAQLEAYRNCIENYRSESKWIGFIDIDEFVIPKNEIKIYDLLKKYNRTSGAILCYWRVMGSGGKISRNITRLVTEEFVVSWGKYCDIGKCFYNTNFDTDLSYKRNGVFHHLLWTKCYGIPMPPRNILGRFCFNGYNHINSLKLPVQINHYLNKSLDEYEKKINKGDVFFSNNPHNLEYFLGPEKYCSAVDYSAYQYLIKLKLALSKCNW